MKRFFSVLLLQCLALLSFADNDKSTVPSKLTEVTVYKSQARLIHEAAYNISSGTTEVVIENISTSINPATLQVFIKGSVQLISATYKNDYIKSAVVTPQVKKWQDSVEAITDKLTLLNAQKTVYQEEEALLKANQSLSNEKTPFTANDVLSLADMYRKRAMELKEKIIALDKTIKQEQEVSSRIQKQINEYNAVKNRPTGQIILTLHSATPVSSSVRCAYNVTNARWTPQYDLRSEGWAQPVLLVQKADVFQNTGLDWKDVKLTISTGNPSLSHNRPILNPLYVNYTEYRPTQETIYKMDMKRSGWESDKPAMNMALEEKKYDDEGYDPAGTQSNTMNEGGVSVTYDLKIPQDVPTDGKAHTILYDQQEIQAAYIYHVVPRMEQAAFLLAKIPDWGKYNLMAGNANIFFEGAYVGQSYINPNVTSDTLLLSFGRDERITIKRNKITELCGTKCVGNTKTATYVFDIVVKNTKMQNIEIEILDQLPVSKQEDIKVEMQSNDGATYNAEIGKLEWNLKLLPGQSHKIRLAYTIKYPKNKQIFESN